MWLLRLHKLSSPDYRKIKSLCKKGGFSPKKFSTSILLKAVLIHIFIKKSWRKVAEQFSLPYLPVYQFYQKIKNTEEFLEILEYLCKKGIIIWIQEGTSIQKTDIEKGKFIPETSVKIKVELQKIN